MNTGSVTPTTDPTDPGLLALYQTSGFTGGNFAVDTTPEFATGNITHAFKSMVAAHSGGIHANLAVRMQPGDPVAYDARDTYHDNLLFFAGTTMPMDGVSTSINYLNVVVPEPASMALLALGSEMLFGPCRREQF